MFWLLEFSLAESLLKSGFSGLKRIRPTFNCKLKSNYFFFKTCSSLFNLSSVELKKLLFREQPSCSIDFAGDLRVIFELLPPLTLQTNYSISLSMLNLKSKRSLLYSFFNSLKMSSICEYI